MSCAADNLIPSDGRDGPVHPGRVLFSDFLEPWGMSVRWLEKALHVRPSSFKEIVLGRRRITPKTALLLARYFGTTAEYWLTLQAMYEVELVLRCGDFARQINQVEPLVVQTARWRART